MRRSVPAVRILRCVATRFVALALILLMLPASARADRRFFLYTYSPFLEPPGEMEIETWLTTRSGKQDPGVGTQWEPRVEFEYALHGRLGTAAYLNFAKDPGSNLEFRSPSLELIYGLAAPGKIAGDPALYLEASETGDELEIESKLLLAHRVARWVGGMNLIGEFEFRHDDKELLPGGRVLSNAVAGEVTGGIAYEFSRRLSIGVESRYRSEHPNFGRESAALLAVGPSVNLRMGEMQLAVGVLPQVWGSPATSGNRNLEGFEKVQTRVIMGIEL